MKGLGVAVVRMTAAEKPGQRNSSDIGPATQGLAAGSPADLARPPVDISQRNANACKQTETYVCIGRYSVCADGQALLIEGRRDQLMGRRQSKQRVVLAASRQIDLWQDFVNHLYHE